MQSKYLKYLDNTKKNCFINLIPFLILLFTLVVPIFNKFYNTIGKLISIILLSYTLINNYNYTNKVINNTKNIHKKTHIRNIAILNYLYIILILMLILYLIYTFIF